MIKNQWTKVATSDEKVASSDQKVATSGQNVTREKRRYYTFETKKRLKYIPKMC